LGAEVSGATIGWDRVEFFEVEVDRLLLFRLGKRNISLEQSKDCPECFGLGDSLFTVLGDKRVEFLKSGLMFILSSRDTLLMAGFG